MVSVLILTRNEAADLPACLASVAFSDDVHVLDSFSTDATVALAAAAGAHVTQRVFDDYATHRNFGFTLPFRHPWLLILDADERIPPALAGQIQSTLASVSEATSAFRLQRRDFLFNTWLKRAQMTPFYIRLVRLGRARWTRSVNEVLEIDGTIESLSKPFDHFPFSKGIGHWVEKHNRYSEMEARIIFAQTGLRDPSLRIALRDPDFHTRRLHQKALYYKLPARPLIKWLYMVVLKGAVLDGAAGLTYATLASFYEYLITVKTKELRLAADLPEPKH